MGPYCEGEGMLLGLLHFILGIAVFPALLKPDKVSFVPNCSHSPQMHMRTQN